MYMFWGWGTHRGQVVGTHNPQTLDMCVGSQIHQVLLTTEPYLYVFKAAKCFVFAFGAGPWSSTKTKPA